MNDEAPPIRVAVWGLGPHAERRLLPALSRCEATTLVGVTSRDASFGQQLAALHHCTYWPTPDAMLRSAEVDAILVATPIGLHPAHGHAVLQAGKHLWCEKSLTPSLAQSEALVQEARARSLVLVECFMFLYHAQFFAVSRALGALGPVVSLSSRLFIPHLDRPGFRHSRALGGGALLDVACYPLRAALSLVEGPLTALQAELIEPPGFEVDLMGRSTLAAPSGARVMVEWGFGAAYRNDLTVCCERGSIDVDRVFSKTNDYQASIVVRDERGTPQTQAFPSEDSFVAMFRALAVAHRDPVLRDELHRAAEAQARLLECVRVAAGR
jgi:NDP-hexose-3-ketoreductase